MSGNTGAVSTGRGGARLTGSGPGRGAVNEPSTGAGTASTNWPLISQLELGPLPTAIGCGRDHAELALAEWGLDHLADDAVLLVNELLTNALKASRALPIPTPIVLRLLADDRQLIIEAWDQWTKGLELRRAAPDADHGRGLQVVAALSRRWGVDRISEQHKAVWCELSVTGNNKQPGA
jgi:anti-sigma regulatory factor (Ser/Thr protein kinase)